MSILRNLSSSLLSIVIMATTRALEDNIHLNLGIKLNGRIAPTVTRAEELKGLILHFHVSLTTRVLLKTFSILQVLGLRKLVEIWRVLP